ACAGVGMVFGLIQYVLGRHHLQPGIDRLDAQRRARLAAQTSGGTPQAPLTPEDWRRIGAVGVLFVFASLFLGAYEQAGSTLNLFADRYVHLEVIGGLCGRPLGLSLVTKRAPLRFRSLVMGIFCLSTAAGNWLAGWSARFISTVPLVTLFGVTAAVTIGAGVVLFLLLRPIRN